MTEIKTDHTVYFLKNLEDVVGDLSEVSSVDGHPIAVVGNIAVAVPEELTGKLQGLVGERIGILRDHVGAYRLKVGRAVLDAL